MPQFETSILISGAASGIGRATALALAKDGVALSETWIYQAFP